MSELFIPNLECPEGCEISFDPAASGGHLRLWTQTSIGLRWVGAMYHTGHWFINSPNPKIYQALMSGKNDQQEKSLATNVAGSKKSWLVGINVCFVEDQAHALEA